MKNIFKFSISLFALFILGSCTNDKDTVPSAKGFELRAPGLVPTVVLNATNDADVVANLEWDRSNNGVASVSSYKVQIALSGTNFANPVTANSGNDILVTPDSRTYGVTVSELNKLLYQLPGVECGDATNIDIRIVSYLGTSTVDPFIQYSTNVISLNATPYTGDLPTLAFSSSSDYVNAPKLASSSALHTDDYEGYMYLQPGTYKLYKPDACNYYTSPTEYGVSAANSGTVVENGPDGFVVTTAGHYFIRVNLSAAVSTTTSLPAMSYSIYSYTSFGIFGAAKGFPTGVNKPMLYNAATNKWELTFDFFKGRKFKFKSVNVAAQITVLGGTPTNLVENGADIKVPGTDDGTKQKYDLVLDVSNPRKYTYTLTPNPN